MKRDEIFPSKYIKAADVTQPRTGTIASTGMEQFKNDGRDQQKLVVYFRDRGLKPLVCNMTNYDAIADIYGDDTDRWIGREIELFADRVRFGGKLVDSVRVREPSPVQRSLPVANGAPPRPRPVANPQPPQPAPEPASSKEFYDDEVPFT
jgi:hypothetical protein